ncbi:serine/threonine protein kinase [Marinobacter mobilis]|uniref:Serine/threonine protein kinase n=1 Tax=Marinobacter mobilis TaxID=488533 RepID=A0A1H3AS46_9GAMM|nr:serine/threonine-protein kinase [Marinobacter mobilis]SDX32560.1 Serine/threonine protein kinase [Marinobacter mobilis]
MTQPITLALANGSRIAEYRIERLLGEGGFGLTYLAVDENLHKQVAIKEYLPVDFAMRGNNAMVQPRTESNRNDFTWGLDAFINEARILAKFHNPYIVQVFRYFEANGTAYIVMEYVEGRTLRETVNELGELQEAEIMAVLLPVMDGLMDVHDAGILHRDIKPENILIRDNGKPVLIDFGAARQALGTKSRSITTVITPGYVPIEQYSSKGHVGPWSDIYSLAAVAYFCLTRKRPEDASDRAVHDDLLPARDAANGLARASFLDAIDHGLMVAPQKRPQTLEAWVRALRGESPAPARDTGMEGATTLIRPTPEPVADSNRSVEQTPAPKKEQPAKAKPSAQKGQPAAVERSSNRRGLVILLGLLLIALGGIMAQQVVTSIDFSGGGDITDTGNNGGDGANDTGADQPVATEPDPVPEPNDPEPGFTENNESDAVPEVATPEPEPAPELEPEPEPDEPEVPAEQDTTFHLTVITDPENPHFVLYGDPRRYSPGIELANGSYRLKISMPGFRTVEITIESDGEDVVREITLVREITPEEQALFDQAKRSRTVENLQAYLDQYPLGSYADRVRSWLEEARAAQTDVAEEQSGDRQKQAHRAWRACEDMPWKTTPANGQAVFDIPRVASGNFRMQIGRTTVQASQISRVAESSPLRELCSGSNCYVVTAPFGNASFTISQGGREHSGEACFYYPDERFHSYRVDL